MRDVARSILSGDRYGEPRTNIVVRALRWLADHLFPSSLRNGASSGRGIVGLMIIVALLVLVAWLMIRVIRSWRPATAVEIPETEVAVEADVRRSADEWGRLADQLSAAERFAEALRARYGELVTRLADDGSVAPTPGRTTGELRADVALSRPAGSGPFDEASTSFDAVWYGGEEASAADVERVRALGAAVMAAQRVYAPEPPVLAEVDA